MNCSDYHTVTAKEIAPVWILRRSNCLIPDLLTASEIIFLFFFLSLFASYRSLQNDNGHDKKDITVKFITWNLKDLTRIPL
jgi:hypothetical protein